MMTFGENLQFLRKRANMTQEDLAEKMEVSRQSVSKWESNVSYPETDAILRLCSLFHCDNVGGRDLLPVPRRRCHHLHPLRHGPRHLPAPAPRHRPLLYQGGDGPLRAPLPRPHRHPGGHPPAGADRHDPPGAPRPRPVQQGPMGRPVRQLVPAVRHRHRRRPHLGGYPALQVRLP
ncbi:MAG: helix-turn-helix domain-containing protein [Oscillospiraceae bacterium]|nr:helix-turn-helix domain-containing protein [Oscillospiraceae bacterium]